MQDPDEALTGVAYPAANGDSPLVEQEIISEYDEGTANPVWGDWAMTDDEPAEMAVYPSAVGVVDSALDVVQSSINTRVAARDLINAEIKVLREQHERLRRMSNAAKGTK